ncbi:MAG: propionyl-CoA synthetase [Candidatus Thiodiazotropha sp.]|nr:propionyl-CoA synthetase [Candidatus Thiodiazotropha sp. (ex Lucina pensylvanica)]MBT3062323.1 propionyl-CoA synthetase [Candidatus Thiodiazotropha sp. (ex Lucina pensylvanica)]PUB72062.1 MAG: propionyl-CoA synthetase [gamma proteobacterium symbiont of Ctena orbiculata]PUB79140.1 MAG: propionyl-CoA synthetase [gamma proteobacterium symbiont of Ctena orbiculata]
MSRYAEIYQQSLNDPESFWGTVAKDLHWHKPWEKVLDESAKPSPRWFSGGMFNTCFNALDRHVEAGNGDRPALIYDSPVTDQKLSYSYRELRDTVSRLAGAIAAQGVGKGDRVIIYMPMIPEAAIAMLACARIGAIHSVVFGGFAAKELATRIDDSQPKMVLSASCGIEPSRLVAYKPLLDEAIEIARHKPVSCIIKQRPQLAAELQDGRDLDWDDALASAEPADCIPVAATDPLYILYTSGTTGQPKGVVRDNGGHAAALLWSMKNIYNVEAGDVYWAASDVGWVVGHSYIVYGPLLAGCTTVIYEGKPVGTPDPGAFWRVISEYGVKVLFTAPTAFRAIKKEDPQGAYLSKYDIGCMDTLFLAGERCDPDTLHWAETMLDKPVIDHWWQTETGWAIAANPMGVEALPVKAGSPTVSMVGYDVQVLDDQGNQKAAGEMGDIVIKQPLPPSCLPTLWNNEQRFVDSYLSAYPGYYLTGDAGYKDEDGYLWIMSRTDDVINVAGHRLSTGQMEEVLAGHADVAECAVIGVADALKGQLPLGLVVLKTGVERSVDELSAELVKRVREQIGPVAAFKHLAVVKRLPKTRSGKILRGTMVKIADGEEWKMPATIDDPAILDEISSSLQTIGYAK